jgi:hypothetical protein
LRGIEFIEGYLLNRGFKELSMSLETSEEKSFQEKGTTSWRDAILGK